MANGVIWYAKIDGGKVIASGHSYRECSDAAFAAMPWGGFGEVAPYILTTVPPKDFIEDKEQK